MGDEQALLIEQMLRQRLSPQHFAKHHLLCGNAAQFQGDERDVIFLSMVDGPHRVKTQWPVGAYRIDLVVEGKARRLAVECDGEKWHTPEQLQCDLERQAILERLGWVFVRIRGSVFFRDPDTAMAPVFVKLDHLGIEPLGVSAEPPRPTSELQIERLRKQAETLRARG